jgi:hypothetical protein
MWRMMGIGLMGLVISTQLCGRSEGKKMQIQPRDFPTESVFACVNLSFCSIFFDIGVGL